MPAIGIDLCRNRHQTKGPWVVLDLAQPGAAELVIQIIDDSPDLQVVWLGIPCGTASRALEIPGQNKPKPVRTEQEPWGITTRTLTRRERAKLEAANKVYETVLKIVRHCQWRWIAWIIENPGNSLLWYIDEFAALLKMEGVKDLGYHACMVGSRRKKWQRLRGHVGKMEEAFHGKWCDGSHVHAAWQEGGWSATAEEAEYPEKLCELVASCWTPWPTTKTPGNKAIAILSAAISPKDARRQRLAQLRSATGLQTKQHTRLIQEYKIIYDGIATGSMYQNKLRSCFLNDKAWVKYPMAGIEWATGMRMIRPVDYNKSPLTAQAIKDGTIIDEVSLAQP